MLQNGHGRGKITNTGRIAGFLLGYFIFTTITYFIAGRDSIWRYWHFMILTATIFGIGTGLKRYLTSSV